MTVMIARYTGKDKNTRTQEHKNTNATIQVGDTIAGERGKGWVIINLCDWQTVVRDLIGDFYTHMELARPVWRCSIVDGERIQIMILKNKYNGNCLYYQNGKFYRYTGDYVVTASGVTYYNAEVDTDEENLFENLFSDYDEYQKRRFYANQI